MSPRDKLAPGYRRCSCGRAFRRDHGWTLCPSCRNEEPDNYVHLNPQLGHGPTRDGGDDPNLHNAIRILEDDEVN
jgi:hypothetical protein